jgi:tripartite-type tricarboxylate transporter receptor subunit TctC
MVLIKRLLVVLVMVPALAFAWQPTKPVEVVVPFAPGSANEVLVRITSEEVTKNTGVVFNIIHKPGAGGVIGNEYFSKLPADGHSVLAASINGIVAMDRVAVPSEQNRTYKTESFVYPIHLAESAFAVVTLPTDPVSTPPQLVEVLKNEKISFAASGGARLIYEELANRIKFKQGVDGVQRIDHRGPTLAITDVIGGHIRFAVVPISIVSELYKDKKLKIIAIAGKKKSVAFPEINTLNSVLPGFDINSEWALALQKDVSPDVLQWYHTEFSKAYANPSLKELFKKQQFEINSNLNTPAVIGAYMKKQTQDWKPLIDTIAK